MQHFYCIRNMSKSIFKIFVSILLVVLTLASCKSVNQDHALAACGSSAVPDMDLYDLKGGTYTCRVLEVDTYGRVLFEYITFSEATGEKLGTAYVICQQYDKDYIYYYKDASYSLESNAEQLNKLKMANDWECILNYEKMYRRGYVISLDLYLHLK